MHWHGSVNQETDRTADESNLEIRKDIRNALQLCRRYALWPTECYTLALTGKILLKTRNIESTLYIGFMKDEKGKYKGHAWLRAGDRYICGYKEAAGFQVSYIFS